MPTEWEAVYYRVRQRCNDKNRKNYKNYGGRGIKCLLTKEDLRKLWMRDKAYNLVKPSIDRKNNDGNYSLSNCRFIELRKNASIRRNSMKKTCPRGHRYSGNNLYMNLSRGFKNRVCRKCAVLSRAKYNSKKGD